MRKGIWAMAMVAGACVAGAETVPLWPEGKMPLAKGEIGPDRVAETTDDSVRYAGVSRPTITIVRARDEGPTPAVVICPGGGYRHLAWGHEGCEISQWLVGQRITAVILKYRVPDQPDAAFADAQRALGYVRANALRYNVDPRQIGIIGFSAGANLAARVSTNHKTRSYAPVDAVDAVSCRPDFSMIIYPWALVPGDRAAKRLPLTLRETFPVDATTPPAFIVQAEDDSCHVENALAYYAALKFAGVPATMHLFPDGGHGYGLRPHGKSTDSWPVLAENWLSDVLED